MNVTLLSGGVGGARMARGFQALPGIVTTVVVNTGDDQETHGLYVSPDVDTVVYTLAGLEGPQGWGRAGDTFRANDVIGILGSDNTFRLGDLDLGLKIHRTVRLADGEPLSAITRDAAKTLGVTARVLPVTDARLRTQLRTEDGEWISFQEYFVHRRHNEPIAQIRFDGKGAAAAPGVIDSIEQCDVLVIAPSNPPLSIWPILAVAGVREAVESHPRTVAVSPLIGGKAVRGPVARLFGELGLGEGSAAVIGAYEGLIQRLVVDVSDEGPTQIAGVEIQTAHTLITEPEASRALADAIVTG